MILARYTSPWAWIKEWHYAEGPVDYRCCCTPQSIPREHTGSVLLIEVEEEIDAWV